MKDCKLLRIGVDARLINYNRGIGNYTYNLYKNLVYSFPDHEYIFYTINQAESDQLRKKILGKYQTKVVKSYSYPLWEQLSLPVQAQIDKLDILHCPANTGPIYLDKSINLIITVHDVMFMLPPAIVPYSPSYYQLLGRFYRDIIFPRVAKRSDKIITVSDCSRKDLLDQVPINKEKVVRIYEASPRTIHDEDTEKKQIREFDLLNKSKISNGKYILSLGAIDPRKNTERILRAFKLFCDQSISYCLIIAGFDQKGLIKTKKIVEQLKLENNVELIGFVSDEELSCLYKYADMMVYPSLYEGFGFPVLEAMSFGTPLITSNISSMPEIALDAAILVNPESVEEIFLAMLKLSNQEDLRQSLIFKGKNRSMDFSWEKVALETMDVFENLFFSKSKAS